MLTSIATPEKIITLKFHILSHVMNCNIYNILQLNYDVRVIIMMATSSETAHDVFILVESIISFVKKFIGIKII